jgi:hypothetical protein
VYERDAATGEFTLLTTVINPTAAAGTDGFGASIDLIESEDGTVVRLAVGAPLETVGLNGKQGTAHVFTLSGSSFVLDASLPIPAGEAASSAEFGASVAFASDDALAVGIPGNLRIAVYTRDENDDWVVATTLESPSVELGTTASVFGQYVGVLEGRYIVTPATADSKATILSFDLLPLLSEFDVTPEPRTLSAPASATKSFADNANGRSGLVIAGDWALASDPEYSAGKGRVTVYKNTDGSWDEESSIVGATAGHQVGFSIDIRAAQEGIPLRFAVGVPGINSGEGEVWVYELNAAGTAFDPKTTLTPGQDAAGFGKGVSLGGDLLVVSYGAALPSTNYVFSALQRTAAGNFVL